MAKATMGQGKRMNPLAPQNEVEREFMKMIEDARRMVANGPIPGLMLPGVEIKNEATGGVMGDLLDEDILVKFRAACEAHQKKRKKSP